MKILNFALTFIALASMITGAAEIAVQAAGPQTGNQEATTAAKTAPQASQASPVPSQTSQPGQKPNQAKSGNQASSSGDRLEPDDTAVTPSDVPAETIRNRRESISEERASVLPYYNNFMRSYTLGPEDVISVSVFNQDRYSKTGIVIPPDGVIAYPLIPEGIFVAGKTTQQVAEEIRKHYDEYVIDPKVTVSLDKAVSARFFVVGDVAQPGVKAMTRRLTVYEALSESGGVLPTGDKKKVVLLRRTPEGTLQQIPVNISAIEKGRMPDNIYLVPGDEIAVPGNTFKRVETLLGFLPIVSFARIFAGGY